MAWVADPMILSVVSVVLVFFAVVWVVVRSRPAPPAPGTAVSLDAVIPESRTIAVGTVELCYVQAGDGRDLVLLHGIGASLFIWRFIFPYLQSRYRVTALDLAGFGRSEKSPQLDYGLDAQAALVAKALDALGIERAALAGSSMGGAIALWMAKREPERFSKVVALAPATDPGLVPAAAEYFAALAPLLKRAINRRTMKMILKRVVARHDRITDDVVDRYLEPFTGHSDAVRAFWSAMKLLKDRRLPWELKELAADVLVIYGERDLMVPRASIDRLMGTLPRATLRLHADGGHHIMEDEPEWTAREIETFLE